MGTAQLPVGHPLTILVAENTPMPIYEFYSPDTNKIYSFLARSLSYADKTPRCPDGPKCRMEKQVSAFAVVGRAKEPAATPSGADAMDDAKMEAAMKAMESEFAGLDADNPDPRQMGRMMRRMSELTGEKMPPEMEEMTRRMEAGEDPEKLEAEYGDALGEPDAEAGPEKPAETAEDRKKARLKSRLRRQRPAPTRDATLYDMAEYVK
jgi:hypothetical protein